MSIVKYAVNYNQVVYDFKTNRYYVRNNVFESYRDARANQWQCEKCSQTFSNYKELRSHKIEDHSY